MAVIPPEALESQTDLFWHRFWHKVNLRPEVVLFDLETATRGICPTTYVWAGGKTRDGYGRVVSGVGGELRAHHAAWMFYHRDLVPYGADVAYAEWCRAKKLCQWPLCLVLVPSRREQAGEITRRLIRAYNSEVIGIDSLP